MSVTNEEYIISKSGVKVYRKPEYHPLLKGTNLSHCDFLRKMSETFPKHIAEGLPKICSENSEDALTWHYFSPLLSATGNYKRKWLKAFLTKALWHIPDNRPTENLENAQISFWRGKEKSPIFSPPPGLNQKEGNTEVDVLIRIPDQAIIFVESKYKSPISSGTIYDSSRDQIIRNLDVGSYYAWKNEYDFFFILLTEKEDEKSKQLLDFYHGNPKNVVEILSHRDDIPEKLHLLMKNLGYITWDRLQNLT